MKRIWDDLNARARGLATHLLGRERLSRLARLPNLPCLAVELDRLGIGVDHGSLPAGPGDAAAAIERAQRRTAAARLTTLQRWCGDRTPCLTVVFEEEDRRSLRALLRGAVAGAPADVRLAGLLPTPTLPAKALRELALQETPAAIASVLTMLGNPYGPILLEEAGRAHPDLLILERALDKRFAERARQAARLGGRALSACVRQVIDLENALTAVVIAGGGSDQASADAYLPGGGILSLSAFVKAAGAPGRSEAAGSLERTFANTRFGEVFGRCTREPAGLEDEILAARIREHLEAARREPLGPSVLLGYLLRLRAEAADLRRIVWGMALGAPRESIANGLVTVA